MFPADQAEARAIARRELTPVRLCFVRLSWRQRARPSTTLHEIQIGLHRLEYNVCTMRGMRKQEATVRVEPTSVRSNFCRAHFRPHTSSTNAAGSNSVRRISSGQSVNVATRQLHTKATSCPWCEVLISEHRRSASCTSLAALHIDQHQVQTLLAHGTASAPQLAVAGRDRP